MKISSSTVILQFDFEFKSEEFNVESIKMCRSIKDIEWLLQYLDKYYADQLDQSHLSLIPMNKILEVLDKSTTKYTQASPITLDFQNQMLKIACLTFVYYFHTSIKYVLDNRQLRFDPTVRIFFSNSRPVKIICFNLSFKASIDIQKRNRNRKFDIKSHFFSKFCILIHQV